VDKTYEYFTEVLGFAGHGRWPGPDGNTIYAMVSLPTKYGNANLMLGPYDMAVQGTELGEFGRNLRESPETLGNGVVAWFMVPDVDKYHAFLKSRGANIDEAPKDQFWGDRTMSVLVPDGYYLTFATPIKGYKPGPGMGEAEGVGAVQATAPGTKRIPLPSAAKKATKSTAAKKKKR
jgi:catechol 2,3-dioxygenase-like lactoylglutathione lyase family enzyme